MRRREAIAGLGASAFTWALAARGQQPDRQRRIGVLMGYVEPDPEAQTFVKAFAQALAELGWTDGRNIRIDYRWGGGDLKEIERAAKELVELKPDIILANTTPVTAALQRETRTISIVFVSVSDPVGNGFVASLARPGRNITGFINFESSMGGKWLELLKEIAPNVTRAALMFNPNTAPGSGTYFLPTIEAAAAALNVEPIRSSVHDDTEIEKVIADLGREPGGGLVVTSDVFMRVHRNTILAAAARSKIPAVYPRLVDVRAGGLIGFGTDTLDLFVRGASYVDRILRGENPSDLPVQVPSKFQLVINLRTAKALGLTVPLTLLARADEVIE
jgi:putative tryptophan/tyrosine transport system substrate-binding protein